MKAPKHKMWGKTMATILLKLAGPLQSWGADSRFTERKTRHEPTKSGIVGLLAAALGRRRTQDIADLAKLSIAVRLDQPGHFERDFQSAHTRKFDSKQKRWVFSKALPLSNRYYISDAVFVVALEGDDELIRKCAQALDHPHFPLYLGRRSCPPSERILLAHFEDAGLMQSICEWPWEATKRIRRKHAGQTKELELIRDVLVTDSGNETREDVHDVPLSFSQEHRQYAWRTVVHDRVVVTNPDAQCEHDPMSAVEDAEVYL